MSNIDFIQALHTSTKRDYLKRVLDFPKAEAAKKAKKFGYDYWDGERTFGYGGYQYDGRWKPVAAALADHYRLQKGSKVLDIGCGKGFLLYDLLEQVPEIEIQGLEISNYAIAHAKKEVAPFIKQGNATNLPYENNAFDLVLAINVLHNLQCYDLEKALKEIERVSAQNSYIVMDAYRTEEERVNLFYWQLTCSCIYSIEEWQWWFNHTSYTGDYSFVFFE